MLRKEPDNAVTNRLRSVTGLGQGRREPRRNRFDPGAKAKPFPQSDAGEFMKLEEIATGKVIAGVVPGKLVSVVTWDGVASLSRMPSGSSSKIDDCSISKIESWVAAGAPNN